MFGDIFDLLMIWFQRCELNFDNDDDFDFKYEKYAFSRFA